ncbi:zinc metalloprotease [Dyella jejuensis]
MQANASLIDSASSGNDTINAIDSDTIQISSGDDTIDVSDNASITVDSGAGVGIVGDGDTVTGDGSNAISVSGQGDVIDVSNATIDISSNDAVTVTGSNDTIVGGSTDSVLVTGTSDNVSATDSNVVFDGANTDDSVFGAGDTGGNWSEPDPDDTGDEGGYGGYSGGGDGYDGGGYGYGLTKWKGKKPTATQVAKAEQSDSVYEGAKWADQTITWSFANASGNFSDSITDTKEQQAIEQAFQAWAKASGLNFEEVQPGAKADIEVGFSDLNPASTSAIGLTTYTSQAGALTGVDVELEDPNQAPLDTNGKGALTYANTSATFEQVALHEIGHALGLADNDIAGSIMNAVLGTGNQTLSATDIADIQSLYGNTSTTAASSAYDAQVHQLVQAMGTFDAAGADTGDFNPQAEAYLYQEHMLASAHPSVHVA